MKVLVTGAAGFIGAALCRRLLARGDGVVGVDNLNDYYDVDLKRARLQLLRAEDAAGNFTFLQTDVANRDAMQQLFAAREFDAAVHLAAQAGVRYSLQNPAAYIDANLTGFGNILEGCRAAATPHLIFASSSSVYGAGAPPHRESDRTDSPLSLYAASKKANELMAHSYSHLYDLRCTGLRFFTVYGPWGRPDMAFFKFAKMMLAGEAIPVYNRGALSRDFTYIDDAVDGVLRVLDSPRDDVARHKIYNLGRGMQTGLMEYIAALETALGVTASYEMLPMQAGDVHCTQADITAMQADFGYAPATSVQDGLARFAEWYREYYDGGCG